MQRRRFLAVALASSLLLAACSDNGDDTAAIERSDDAVTTTESTTTTTASSPEAVPTTTSPPPQLVSAGPVDAGSPAELASRLTAAETLTRDPGTGDDDIATAAFEMQVLYRQLARTPEWDAAVLAAVPAPLQTVVTNHLAARREFRAMHSKLSDTLPAWRIVSPPPADELLRYYQEAEATFGVPWEILAAVNLVETGMGRIRGVSVAGAQGPMQFMPATWEAFGEGGDVNDPRDAIMGAARYLAHNGGGRGEIDNALWNYNHSNRYVRGVKHYAAIIAGDHSAFRALYHWQIVYLSTVGDILLPEGYAQAERITVTDYLAAHPDHHISTATN